MARKRDPFEPIPLPFGPFKGQQDALSPDGEGEAWATRIRNGCVRRAADGSGVFSRPGFAKGAKPATGEAQGSVYFEAGGYQWELAVVGGGFYKMDLSGSTWSANVKPAGVTINATGRVFVVPVPALGVVIVSDGVNRPWKFNPSTNVGSYLTDMAEAAYGKPIVYAAKVMFIRTSDRTTMTWSNEGTVDLGYAAANNNWQLRQTGSEPLVALLPTNAQLYFFREHSVGAINGSIGPDFSTATTQDSVDPKFGTLSPDGPVAAGDRILFPDQNGQLRSFQIGGVGSSLLEGATVTLSDVNKGRLPSIWGVHLDDLNAVAWAMPLSSGSTANNDLVVFGVPSLACWGTWGYTAAQAIDFKVGNAGKDGAGRSVFYHFDADGDFYVQRQQDQAAAAYETIVGNTLIEFEVVTPFLGYDHNFDKVFDSAMLDTLRDAAGYGPRVSVDYQDARGGATWTPAGRLIVQAANVGSPFLPVRVEVGANGSGRYVKFRFRNLDEGNLVRHTYLGGEVRAFAQPAGSGLL